MECIPSLDYIHFNMLFEARSKVFDSKYAAGNNATTLRQTGYSREIYIYYMFLRDSMYSSGGVPGVCGGGVPGVCGGGVPGVWWWRW